MQKTLETISIKEIEQAVLKNDGLKECFLCGSKLSPCYSANYDSSIRYPDVGFFICTGCNIRIHESLVYPPKDSVLAFVDPPDDMPRVQMVNFS